MKLTGKAKHKAQAGRGVADRVEVKPFSIVLDIKLKPAVRFCQCDTDRVTIFVLDAVLHRVGQELVQYQRERHGRVVG